MKSFFCVAALALAAIANVEATAESSVHIRVHAAGASAPVAEWGACKQAGSGPQQCVSGTVCRVQSEYYGQCIRDPAPKWGQCGGKTPTGTWMGTCLDGAKCIKSSDYYAQCQ
uniref:CBM1 domain-containing protein n=1 Tax=Globisporangium ultimum (strain ATCC 200006 / CBS 805.95 / DAOM BR144) TaxID=431595 RepID=K3WDX8_GLOUD